MAEARPQDRIALSVAVPFYNVDVCPLAEILLAQMRALPPDIEVLFADDASSDATHAARLRQVLATVAMRSRLISANVNLGRAKIRNVLRVEARGDYVLFLDSDMYPDSDCFLARYRDLAVAGAADVVVGGCTYNQIRAVPRSQRLYFYHSARTQCAALRKRRHLPLRYLFTNNVMLKRELVDRIAFDDQYAGWGYEDTDWGFEAARQNARIVHIDNTATHMGLIDDDRLIDKYKESVANFLRLFHKFPLQSGVMPVMRLARRASRLHLPFDRLSRVCERLCRARYLPLRIRHVSLQVLKLCLYSHALAVSERQRV